MQYQYWFLFLVAITGLLVDKVSSQCYKLKEDTNPCPEGWEPFRDSCYKFVERPRLSRTQAQAKCREDYGTLARVGDLTDHNFFNQYLLERVVNKSLKWYTAGMMSAKEFGRYQWEGHRLSDTDFNTELQKLWKIKTPLPQQETTWPKDKKYIVYGSDGRSYGFYLETGDQTMPFICEIRKSDVPTAGIEPRNHLYGMKSIKNIPKAPCFETEPNSLIYFLPDTSGSTGKFEKQIQPGENIAKFTCFAVGYPRPTYRWYIVDSTTNPMTRTAVNPLAPVYGGRFSITDGELTINFPQVSDPSGEKRYQCEAINRYGSILSNQAILTFGQMARFASSERTPKVVNIYKMAALSCDPPATMKPVNQIYYTFYQVIKTGTSVDYQPIPPSTRPMVFASQGGYLYFSAVTEEDNGAYVCMVKMIGSSGGSSQKSPEMKLIVNKGVSHVQRINIHSSFPAVYPKGGFRGDTLRLECFANGNAHASITYSWRKIGGQISSRAHMENLNRVIIIENAQSEDEGEYECTAMQPPTGDSAGGTSKKSVRVSLNARPYFNSLLKNQYVNKGEDVKLVCEGSGKPAISYLWYKGSKLLKHGGRIKIETKSDSSALTIQAITEEESDTYGCEILNSYGAKYSYAWIKVLSFAPNFDKYPLENMEGMVGQPYFMYACNAEGAPNPVKRWYLNGTLLSTTPVYLDPVDSVIKCKAKHCAYKNGNLMISKLANSDSGRYTCEAKNDIGSARSTADLKVMPAPKMTLEPSNRKVELNTTITIPCLAQSEAHLDINYAWFFESHELKFDRLDLDARRYDQAQLLRPFGRNFGSLQIQNVQFENGGRYECKVTTPIGVISRKAWIEVVGPPGACAGVLSKSSNSTYVEISWTRGARHGSNILYYTVEVATVKLPNDWLAVHNLTEIEKEDTDLPYPHRRSTRVYNLAANTQYYARVRAVNRYGPGDPSPRSNEFTTPPKKPVKVVQNITGGGGKRTTLVVRWNAIDEAFYNGPQFKYVINFRQPRNREWLVKKIFPTAASALDLKKKHLEYTITLPEGSGDYQPYDVRVGTENQEGPGPFPTDPAIVRIYSAEAVPTSTPNDVVAAALNSTALIVRWNRAKANKGEGKLQGYRIVYWQRLRKCDSNTRDTVSGAFRQTIYGNVDSGVIIGLDIDQYYCIVVQVFNQAGDGPESGVTEQTTYKRAPSNFPTLVKLTSTGRPNEIKVEWVGISIQAQEESLDGYRIRYWLAGAPSNSYKEVDVGLDTFGYLEELALETRYNVRVYGYSRGGVGEMSSPEIQFMLQRETECTPGIYDGPDMRYHFICSSCRQILSLALFTTCVISSVVLRLL